MTSHGIYGKNFTRHHREAWKNIGRRGNHEWKKTTTIWTIGTLSLYAGGFFSHFTILLDSSVYQSIFEDQSIHNRRIVHFHIFPALHIDYHLNWTFGSFLCVGGYGPVENGWTQYFPGDQTFQALNIYWSTTKRPNGSPPNVHTSCIVTAPKRKEFRLLLRSKVTRVLNTKWRTQSWPSNHWSEWILVGINFLRK